MFAQLNNWRTTIAGVAAILAALADVLTQIVNKDWDSTRFTADLTGLITGFGLIFARDAVASERDHHIDRVAIGAALEKTAEVKAEVNKVAAKVL